MRIILLGPSRQLGSNITEGHKAASGPVELVFGIARAARRFRPGNECGESLGAHLRRPRQPYGLPQNRRCRTERRRSLFSLP